VRDHKKTSQGLHRAGKQAVHISVGSKDTEILESNHENHEMVEDFLGLPVQGTAF
jgi:hypothetical protein